MTKVPLTKGYHAVIDESDLKTISNYAWFVWETGPGKRYAFTRIGNRTFSMHRHLLRPLPGIEVDHINGNGLDNRRSNLRLCTSSGNKQNVFGWRKKMSKHSPETPQYKCVWPSSHGHTWEARICWDGKQRYLGTFPSQIEAALAYDEQARIHHGKFARLNFPGPGERGVHATR